MIFFETALLTAIHGQYLSSWQIQHQGIQLSQAFLRRKRGKVAWRELFLEVHSKWKNGNATNEGMFCGVKYSMTFMGATLKEYH